MLVFVCVTLISHVCVRGMTLGYVQGVSKKKKEYKNIHKKIQHINIQNICINIQIYTLDYVRGDSYV